MTYIPELSAVISTSNSRSTPLGASAVFTGTGEDVSQYASVAVSVWATVGGTIDLQFSTNNTNWDGNQFFSVTSGRSFVLPVQAQFFRIVYTNGPLAQSTFRLQTVYHRSKSLAVSSQLNAPIVQDEPASVTRSVLMGLDGNDYKNVAVGSTGALFAAIREPVSVFDEIWSTNRTPSLQLSFDYIINTTLVDIALTGSATALQSNGMAVLSTSASATTKAVISSKRGARMRAGQEAHAVSAGVFTLGVANSFQLSGVANNENGLFFGYNGAAFGLMRRNNSVDTWTAQTAWNIDPLDGTGPSGMVLDPTQGNTYRITITPGFVGPSYQILNPLTNEFITVHIESYVAAVPTLTVVSMQLWLEVENTTSNTNMVMSIANASVFLNGTARPTGTIGAADNFKLSVGTTLTNILTLRNKPIFAGKVNFINSLMLFYSGAADGNKSAEIQLVFNATLGGTPVWNDFDPANSVIEIDTAGTTVTGGLSGFINLIDSVGAFNQSLLEFQMILKPGDTMTVAAKTTQNNSDINASIIWQEDT